jgi:CheY-like chemotaxis protein
VHVLLPAADEAPTPTELQTLQPRKGTSATILVVEDADDLREITSLILTKNGYQVITAANGPAALEVVKNQAGKIDLLLTDVVMPFMQGPELVDRIAASHPEMRVLYMSGYAQPMLGDSGTLEEGVLLIEKPFTEPVLLDRVEQALNAELVAAAHK